MFEQIFELVFQQYDLAIASVTNNQFAMGGVFLGVAGGIIVYLKSLPRNLYNMGKRSISIDIEIRNDQKIFQYIEKWFHDTKPCRFSKSFKFDWIRSNQNQQYNSQLYIGLGKHWFFYRGTLVVIDRSMDRELDLGMRADPMEYLTFTFYTLRKKKIIKFYDEIIKKYNPLKPKITIHTDRQGYWNSEIDLDLEKLKHNTILAGSLMNELISDINNFSTNQSWYDNLGIPHRRGFLFSGPPGTGKTSTIKQLAATLQSNIYIISDVRRVSKKDLSSLLADVEKNDFVVIEDIDAMYTNICREENSDQRGGGIEADEMDKANYISNLSGLLNSLDGLTSTDGYILFMTTNYIEKLDKALIRPGRIDRIIEFQNLVGEQASRMYKVFFPNASEEFLLKLENLVDTKSNGLLSPAKFQQLLLSTTLEDESFFESILSSLFE